jgi:fumarate hydratase subunit alpha
VPGKKLKLTLLPKGFGAENMSRFAFLKPTEGEEGIVKFVVEAVRQAGANPCPPVVLGVGIGGTMEKAAFLAKKALLRPLNSFHPQKHLEKLEKKLLREINKLGLGPQGIGGKTTCLGVKIETYPTHIAGLPVAVNFSCYALRQGEVVVRRTG